MQPDEDQLFALKQRMKFMQSFSKSIAEVNTKDLARFAHVRQTPYFYPLTNPTTQYDKPFLLIPSNENRISFVIAQLFTQLALDAQPGLATYSYGYPVQQPGFFGAGHLYGSIIPGVLLIDGASSPGTIPSVDEGNIGNGTISIDDIYVTWSNFFNNFDDYGTGFIIAYEGVLAIEGNELAA